MSELVSVIVPNYNHARYLDVRLSSILKQTYQHYEVIILDDHSTDNSKEIIEPYRGHQQVKHVIYNQVNSGSTFRQWQRGIELAKGDLVWIAESDDWCADTFLERLVLEFEKDEAVVLAYADSWLYLEHAKELVENHWGKWLDEEKWKSDYVADGKAEIATVLVYLNSILNASAVVFRKSEFLNIDFEKLLSYRYAGDWLAWSKMLASGKVCYIAEPLNYFRVHDKSTRNNKSIQEELRRFAEIFRIVNSNRVIAHKAGYRVNAGNYHWLFKEWVFSKSKSKSQRLMLFKILPTFLLLPYVKYLSLACIKKLVPKNIS